MEDIMTRKHIIGFGLGIFVLLILTAGASALVTKEIITEKPVIEKVATKKSEPTKRQQIAWNDPQPAPQKQTPACDDKNIVGYVLGGAAGGIAGNQIGKGTGNTAATIGGTLGGAYLGGEYIPTRNVTCR